MLHSVLLCNLEEIVAKKKSIFKKVLGHNFVIISLTNSLHTIKFLKILTAEICRDSNIGGVGKQVIG